MDDQQLKEGDWVKEKNGTQGMTVVAHVKDYHTSERTGEVKCRYKNSVGDTVESNFWEADLVRL
jgi:uncharacterized protein YodC (DUF2158 family)